tara:strand:- start:127 stop:951 length:825 start_codon:yes stop_codon:yes gene_type:complete
MEKLAIKFKRIIIKLFKSSKKLRKLVRNFKVGSFAFRMEINALERVPYAYICYNAAKLAKKLGYKRISVIEYGVGKGAGLLSLEEYTEEIKKILGVEIDIYGFDTGQGLPKPKDYRDLPYHWKEGFFSMDKNDLIKNLNKTKLILGDIESTSKTFFSDYNPAPIGAVIHDFDFYSSTKTALSMMKENSNFFLPRVFSYFDDIIGNEIELYNDYTGERLAINEFNLNNKEIKISQSYHFLSHPNETWHNQIWIIHFFMHEKYNSFISQDNPNLRP